MVDFKARTVLRGAELGEGYDLETLMKKLAFDPLSELTRSQTQSQAQAQSQTQALQQKRLRGRRIWSRRAAESGPGIRRTADLDQQSCGPYSVRKFLAGLADAARYTSRPTVSRAISAVTAPASSRTHHLISTR